METPPVKLCATMNFIQKYILLLWILQTQCLGIKLQDLNHKNSSDRMLSLNLNLQHSVDDSSSTVLAIDPVKSFLLWTIIEAVALGVITTAALGSMHSSYPSKYPPNFYHAPYIRHTNMYDDFDAIREELRPDKDGFPAVTDLLWPTDTELFLSVVAPENLTEHSKPCLMNIIKKTDINPS